MNQRENGTRLPIDDPAVSTFERALLTSAFKGGILRADEKLAIPHNLYSAEFAEELGYLTSWLLYLLHSLPERFFSSSLSDYARAVGLSSSLSSIWELSCTHRNFELANLARSDAVVSAGKIKILEINIGSTVGGLYHATLENRHSDTSYLTSLELWAHATSLCLPLGARVVFLDDSANVSWMSQYVSPMIHAISQHCDCVERLVGLNELRFVDGQVEVQNQPVTHVYSWFGLRDIARNPEAYDKLKSAFTSNAFSFVEPMNALIHSSKAAFGLLWNLMESGRLNSRESEFVSMYIPETRIINSETLDMVKSRRRLGVLKPVDGFGGNGVVVGQEVSQPEWVKLVTQAALAKNQTFIWQEYFSPDLKDVKLFTSDGKWNISRCRNILGTFVHGERHLGGFARCAPQGGGLVINRATGAACGPIVC
ncbi:hypothetical protein [Burkholderia glumae]|uniref:hypothetical protein n=1 Tax=Burkholderia glumae TaxID=337 RepID=UPI0012FAEE68|nr:hypothetical protein [Burkholderia glumae]